MLTDSAFAGLPLAVRTVAAGGTIVTPSIQAKLRELKRRGCTTVSLSPRERDVIRLMEKLALPAVEDVVRYAVRAGMVD